jgi:hypothetical protein
MRDVDELTDEQAAILAFEKARSRGDRAIFDTFGVRPTIYYQRLDALLDLPAAVAAEPVLVNRLRRLRDARRGVRRG